MSLNEFSMCHNRHYSYESCIAHYINNFNHTIELALIETSPNRKPREKIT